MIKKINKKFIKNLPKMIWAGLLYALKLKERIAAMKIAFRNYSWLLTILQNNAFYDALHLHNYWKWNCIKCGSNTPTYDYRI